MALHDNIAQDSFIEISEKHRLIVFFFKYIQNTK